MRIDYKKVSNVEVDGIDHNDYPDYCDAFISYADYHGEEMSEEMLEFINEDQDFVYEQTMKQIF